MVARYQRLWEAVPSSLPVLASLPYLPSKLTDLPAASWGSGVVSPRGSSPACCLSLGSSFLPDTPGLSLLIASSERPSLITYPELPHRALPHPPALLWFIEFILAGRFCFCVHDLFLPSLPLGSCSHWALPACLSPFPLRPPGLRCHLTWSIAAAS